MNEQRLPTSKPINSPQRKILFVATEFRLTELFIDILDWGILQSISIFKTIKWLNKELNLMSRGFSTFCHINWPNKKVLFVTTKFRLTELFIDLPDCVTLQSISISKKIKRIKKEIILRFPTSSPINWTAGSNSVTKEAFFSYQMTLQWNYIDGLIETFCRWDNFDFQSSELARSNSFRLELFCGAGDFNFQKKGEKKSFWRAKNL